MGPFLFYWDLNKFDGIPGGLLFCWLRKINQQACGSTEHLQIILDLGVFLAADALHGFEFDGYPVGRLPYNKIGPAFSNMKAFMKDGDDAL